MGPRRWPDTRMRQLSSADAASWSVDVEVHELLQSSTCQSRAAQECVESPADPVVLASMALGVVGLRGSSRQTPQTASPRSRVRAPARGHERHSHGDWAPSCLVGARDDRGEYPGLSHPTREARIGPGCGLCAAGRSIFRQSGVAQAVFATDASGSAAWLDRCVRSMVSEPLKPIVIAPRTGSIPSTAVVGGRDGGPCAPRRSEMHHDDLRQSLVGVNASSARPREGGNQGR